MKALAIIKNDLWQRRKALIWWTVGVIALVSIDMLLYLSVKDDAQQLNQLMERMPSTFKALFAGNADFLSPSGFLSARIYYLLLPLLLTIFTVGLGSNLIGKEEREGTLELLLSRPVSRFNLLFSKVSAATVAITIVGSAALVTALVCLRPAGFSGVSFRAICFVTLNTLLLSALFGAVALCLSALGGRFKSMSTGIAVLVAFGSYLLASLESLASWIVWPARLLPYHYYNPNGILNGVTYGLKPALGFVCIILVLLVGAWLGFRRRDIG